MASQLRGQRETIIEVRVNCPDEQTASMIAEVTVLERLAAAANILPPINSLYRWQGEIRLARETPLLLKTRRSLFDTLAERISGLHPYETPSILGMVPTFVSEPYETWVNNETAD
ncbi:MAG: divalent-cation tolerance protein CutA [Pseudomonadota bacterium]